MDMYRLYVNKVVYIYSLQMDCGGGGILNFDTEWCMCVSVGGGGHEYIWALILETFLYSPAATYRETLMFECIQL